MLLLILKDGGHGRLPSISKRAKASLAAALHQHVDPVVLKSIAVGVELPSMRTQFQMSRSTSDLSSKH